MLATYTSAQIIALTLFTFAASITPGPNNSMLMASGANFGLRASAAHIGGVIIGYAGLIALCGLGVGAVFAAFPMLRLILKWAGAGYLLWLAWKIATAKGVGGGATAGRPIGLVSAAGFQFINPKGWVIALATISTYVPARGFFANLAVAVAISTAAGVVSTLTWTAFGVGLRRWLAHPVALRTFNVAMAVLLAASLYPLFMEAGMAGR